MTLKKWIVIIFALTALSLSVTLSSCGSSGNPVNNGTGFLPNIGY